MPDIDIDFCYERRQEVIDYVTEKYGADHVAQIITFGTMKAKAVVRDVGRVLGMSYAEVDAVAKVIPFSLDMTLEKAMSVSPQLQEMIDRDPEVSQPDRDEPDAGRHAAPRQHPRRGRADHRQARHRIRAAADATTTSSPPSTRWARWSIWGF